MKGLLVFTTVPDGKTAEKISKALLSAKIAACVSAQTRVLSRYRWKGRIEKTEEVLLTVKTLEKNFDKIRKMIAKNHPYEIPEIIGVPIVKISKAYAAWMAEEIR